MSVVAFRRGKRRLWVTRPENPLALVLAEVAQRIHFCKTVDGVRIAYSTVGEGPALVCPPPWVGHLELGWEQPAIRSFFETLAHHHTVVRFDKHGCGLSDRHRTDFSLESELRQVEAVVDHLKLSRFTFFSASYSGPVAIAYAVKFPHRVSQLILYGTQAKGPAQDQPEVRQALIGLIRAHWGMGSRTIADLVLPDASADDIRWLTRFQQESATAEMATRLYSLAFELDVTGLVAKLRVPALVIHRRGDQAVPFQAGRELAAMIPGASFVLLDGESHPPYFGDSTSVLRAIAEFLGDPVSALAPSGQPHSFSQPETTAGAAGDTGEVQARSASGAKEAAPSSQKDSSPSSYSFRREGEYWAIIYEGAVSILRDVKGLSYLAEMLRSPGKDFHVLELTGLEAAKGRATIASLGRMNDQQLAVLGLHGGGPEGDAGAMLDPEAKAAYKRRLDELREELEEARAFNDPTRAGKAEEEIDFLTRELARAVGLGGRDRKAASNVERARVKVGKAIKAAIGKIGPTNRELERHLAATIRTGTFCSYNPDPRAPIPWQF